MKKVKLGIATLAQMRDFAEKQLGLPVSNRERADQLRAQIAAAWQGEEIFVYDEEAEEKPVARKQAEMPAKPEMVKILIARDDKAGGDEPVPVSVNGVAIRIPRGEPVEVKYHYYHALCNAVRIVRDAAKDGGLMPPREVPEFHVQRLA